MTGHFKHVADSLDVEQSWWMKRVSCSIVTKLENLPLFEKKLLVVTATYH
jgi:hypothetical protein